MSCQFQFFLPINYPHIISLEESANVPGSMCDLALHAPISAQPSAAELALISRLLPELLEQWLTEPSAEREEQK